MGEEIKGSHIPIYFLGDGGLEKKCDLDEAEIKAMAEELKAAQDAAVRRAWFRVAVVSVIVFGAGVVAGSLFAALLFLALA